MGVEQSVKLLAGQTEPDPVPLCPSQIPHDLTRARTLAAAMGSRELTA
jgi:hypothetical protein